MRSFQSSRVIVGAADANSRAQQIGTGVQITIIDHSIGREDVGAAAFAGKLN